MMLKTSLARRSACLLAAVLSFPLLARSAAPAGCTLVAGGGRAPLSADSQVNDRWNRLNFSFFDATAEAARETGDVEQAFFAAGATDTARNLQSLLSQASKAGCLRVAQVAVFTDDTRPEPELVFSLRVSPVKQDAAGSAASLGAAEFEKEYRYPATPESLGQVVPSRIADRAMREYREQSGPADTVNVYRGTGSAQCTGGGSTLAENQKRLTEAGIQVLSSSCGSTGRMYAQRCGGPTGDIHVFEIPASQKDAAIKQQFRMLSDLPGAQKAACPS
ncbi:hypothetical protein [Piscinibacter terrae]|uniref:Uncharacterized protein n=1 Tax=Piscinibacter terrae TaxID=2496871 RepID=A0A3N7HVQ4_9BURK|nr:hypothetical protein [Albitalea terrae]RQP25061.1 hypothetical protein DZC73_09405 [Albitalea terrae]